MIFQIVDFEPLGYCSTTMRVPFELDIIWQVSRMGILETSDVFCAVYRAKNVNSEEFIDHILIQTKDDLRTRIFFYKKDENINIHRERIYEAKCHKISDNHKLN